LNAIEAAATLFKFDARLGRARRRRIEVRAIIEAISDFYPSITLA
jgi:hypothetical protein